jgi:Zn-dependent oligopeptidase
MHWKKMLWPALAGVLAGCSTPAPKPSASPPATTDRLLEFEERAAAFHAVVSIPSFETTTNEIAATITNAIRAATAALDRVGALGPGEVTFNNTVRALDDVGFQLAEVDNRLSLIEQTSTSETVRDAATSALKELEAWMVGLDYREDVYRAVKAYDDTRPVLAGEDARLLLETMRDYRRAGLQLPKAERDEVERMRKELSGLCTDFQNNVTKAEKSVSFTRAELEGVPDDFLKQIKTGDDEYTVKVNVTWH